jgi:hypothetical protein
MKNLVVQESPLQGLGVRNLWVAGIFAIGVCMTSSAIHAQERNLKAELVADFDRIEETIFNEPGDEILMALVEEESGNVEKLVKDGLAPLPSLLEIINSKSKRFSESTRMVALGVAAKVVPEDQVIKAWEDTVQSNQTEVRANLAGIENYSGTKNYYGREI